MLDTLRAARRIGDFVLAIDGWSTELKHLEEVCRRCCRCASLSCDVRGYECRVTCVGMNVLQGIKWCIFVCLIMTWTV
jgi:hypothetical protein